MKDKKQATRQSYGETLVKLGKENENIVVLDADLAGATKTDLFGKEYPDRFFDMGIAEANMLGTAAGLATCGKIPYASTFAVFAAGRAYDQIRNSICYPKLNVKICATHAGITVGEDGATHQMLEDLSLMRGLPNMTVISPSDDTQTKWVIEAISKIEGPVYVRLARLATPIIYEEDQKFEIGKAVQIGEGTDGTVFATGVTVAEAIKAQEELEKQGIHIRVVDMHTIKPIDKDCILKCAKETKRLVSVEDHSVIGGLGSAISEVLTDEYPTKLERMGMPDIFGKSGRGIDGIFWVNSKSHCPKIQRIKEEEMKKKIAIVAVIVTIIVIVVIFLVTSHGTGRIEGYGYGYTLPDNYKFIIVADDKSSVDGPLIQYFIYEDKIIYSARSFGPNFESETMILYDKVDTNHIEYLEPKEMGAIRWTDTSQIQKAIEGKKGKTMCDYVEYFNT